MTQPRRNPQYIDGIIHPAQKPKAKKFRIPRKIYPKVAVVFGLLTILLTTILILHFRHSSRNQDNVTVVKGEVAQHMMLPNNEQPALATVTDSKKLNSVFLKQAHDGDKILIYAKAKRVIIYRPSIDRIIDIGPIQIDTPPQAPATQ
jgi:hypothetical protein